MLWARATCGAKSKVHGEAKAETTLTAHERRHKTEGIIALFRTRLCPRSGGVRLWRAEMCSLSFSRFSEAMA